MSEFKTKWSFAVRERLKGRDTARVLHDMETRQWWSREGILALQLERLRAFLRDVGAHVPYYRETFARLGFDAANVKSLADFQRLPLLTLAEVRAHADALRIEGQSDAARVEIGGGNGEPLVLGVGRERMAHDLAALYRALRWWEVDVGESGVVVWGPPIEDEARGLPGGSGEKLAGASTLMAFELSDAKAARFVARIRKTSPKMLLGNPSTLLYLGDCADKEGVTLNDVGARVTMTLGEPLVEEQRKSIARHFGAPVAYGLGDAVCGLVAFQCPAGGLHVNAEHVVVEIVDADGKPLPAGHAGEIVVTNLTGREFPFVRYRTGYVGTLDWDTCTCRRGLPALKDVRAADTTAAGR
ncbi:MAG: phenylacetate--CoA ligase family protein [Azoarcus sp.]|jgi:phenylacetate-CoA ligase|nr:phenylacetate--CoA ligase family protein [Azoarcus sp.]